MTAAFVVTWKGRLIAERYGDGITPTTPLESWSMGKSVTATLMGVLIKQGVYQLWQPAPIPEWQGAGDPRAKIRIGDILHMSSGLRIRAPQDPDYDPSGPYPDHLYLYTGGVDSFQYAATRPQQWPPDTVGRYRNTDPVLINYLVRLAVEKRGEEYLSFPAARAVRQDRRPHDGDRDRLRTAIFSLRVRSLPRRAIGRVSATCICRTASGTASGFSPRATSSSSARSRPRGQPTSVPSTAASSGSTATVRSRSRGRRITWRAPAGRRR